VLVDFPATSTFLTPQERSYVIWRKSKYTPNFASVLMISWTDFVKIEYDNSSVGEEEHFEMRHFWAVLSDWQLWLHILIYMSIVGPRTSLSTFPVFIINIYNPVYGITLFLP
jgi:hypothetical protein